MIDGLKLSMQGDKLIARLNARIKWHEQVIEQFKSQLPLVPSEASESRSPHPEDILKFEIEEHQECIEALSLISSHIVPDETYLLGERDLRFAELLSERHV